MKNLKHTLHLIPYLPFVQRYLVWIFISAFSPLLTALFVTNYRFMHARMMCCCCCC